ncbi:MAG: 3-deoxy-D-manno-octulosonic acid transferase [Bacteroidetes bacterium]|nr:3-deoxy-D-manno-octulosonic acid transferase [Bacteroidota bacterium]
MPTVQVFIYDVCIQLYRLGIFIASPFSSKAKRWLLGRDKLFPRLGKNITSIHGKKIWIHCASLGEFEQARPLIEKLKQLNPEHKIILTFFSPSGYDVRKYFDLADYVSYLPLDTAENARKFIGMMKPSIVIWVKYEYWYHFLNHLQVKNIPVVLISAIIREEHVFFKWYGALHRRMLGFFTHIFVQNEESKKLLQSINIASEVCPDTRFDRVVDITQQRKQYDNIAKFKGDKKLFIAGSTWAKDNKLICRLINNDPFAKNFKYIIAPHNVTEGNINYLTDTINWRSGLFSRITTQNADEIDVMIVDGIGALSSLYYYADIAYVGGGFGASVHNILEPAVYGMPVIFGPNHLKSAEAVEMLSHKDWHAAYSISGYKELYSTIASLLDNEEAALKTGSQRSKEYVLAHTGGTDQIYSWLKDKKLI